LFYLVYQAGKGTQAKAITGSQRIPHISTGELFRRAYEDKTGLGILANDYMSKGELVPDEVTIGIALQRLDNLDCTKGFYWMASLATLSKLKL
jgi:adenylate kinase